MPEVLDRDAVSDDIGDEVQSLLGDAKLPAGDGTNQKEALRRVYRELAKRSLYFLTKAVLGYRDLTPRTHKGYADFLQDLSKRKTLDLMPRGVFKTTIGTIGFSIWYLLNHPEHSILIGHQNQGNAEKMLLEIESHLDGSNKMMNWLFPEMIRPHKRYTPWSSTQMTVPNSKSIRRTPSIMVLGVGGRAESLHFNVIINDDLIGSAAMESEAVMLDAIAWHDYSTSLFIKPHEGIERCHGTRWSLNDLYSVLLKDPEYSIYWKEAEDSETGELLFPEWLPRDELRRIKERNFAHYMSQYQNNPRDPASLDFSVEWLRKYLLLNDGDGKGPYCQVDGQKFYVADMDVVLAVDPAGSGDADMNVAKVALRGRAKRANNAVGVVGLHGDGRYFLLDLWVGRGVGQNPELQVAEQMLAMARRWHGYVRRGYVESYGAQSALITVFNMLARQNNFFFPVDETPRGVQKAKKVRIRTMVGSVAQNGMLHVRAGHDMFINEFGDFPQSDNFDTLDMMYWALYHLQKPRSRVEEYQVQQARLRKKRSRRMSVSRAGY